MNKTLTKAAMLIAGCLILSGCQFATDEENFVEVSSEPIKSIELNLSDLSDTIQLIRPMVIYYDLKFPKEVRHLVTVLVGEQKVYESDSLTGSFELSPFQFQDGYHQLKMQVVTSSGTNSLADQLGYEAVLFELKKVVWVDKSPPQKINITKMERLDGNLVISWEKYPKSNFESYLLYKNVYSEGSEPSVSEIYYITDRNETSFVDPTYIGGKAEYYIVTRVTTSLLTAYGEIYSYNAERAKIKEYKTVNGKLVVTWNKPLFYNAFQKYWLRQTGDFANPYFESTNINDTTATISNLGFGITVELELNTVPLYAPSGGGPSTAMYSTYHEVSVGDKFATHEAVFNNPTEQLVYYYNGGFLYVMHEDENLPYDSIQLTLNQSVDNRKSFGLSRNGKYLYVGSQKSLVQLNPITLDVLNNTDFNSIIPGGELYPYAIAVGNQNLLSIDVKIPFPSYQTGYITDFIAMIDGNTLAVKDTIKSRSDILTITGNDDLSYIYENNPARRRLLHMNSAGVEISRKDYGAQVQGECFFKDNKAYVFAYWKRWIIDLSTMNITQEIPIEDWVSYIKIDQTLGELAGIVSSNNDYVVFDCVSFQELKRIKMYQYAISDIVSSQNNFSYWNGVLYAARGYKVRL